MTAPRVFVLLVAALLLPAGAAMAGRYGDTVSLFKNAGQSAASLDNCCGYAVFPTLGKGGALYQATVAGQKFSFKPRTDALAAR